MELSNQAASSILYAWVKSLIMLFSLFWPKTPRLKFKFHFTRPFLDAVKMHKMSLIWKHLPVSLTVIPSLIFSSNKWIVFRSFLLHYFISDYISPFQLQWPIFSKVAMTKLLVREVWTVQVHWKTSFVDLLVHFVKQSLSRCMLHSIIVNRQCCNCGNLVMPGRWSKATRHIRKIGFLTQSPDVVDP